MCLRAQITHLRYRQNQPISQHFFAFSFSSRGCSWNAPGGNVSAWPSNSAQGQSKQHIGMNSGASALFDCFCIIWHCYSIIPLKVTAGNKQFYINDNFCRWQDSKSATESHEIIMKSLNTTRLFFIADIDLLKWVHIRPCISYIL
jgi:hypothetical protein